jgi:MoxR-like ATPase
MVPRIGMIEAAPGFQVIATQNPVEYIATGHLSEALRDRFEHVALEYQSAGEEAAIVVRETGSTDETLVWRAVAITRATRINARFKKGSSVRGAIATVAIATRLMAAGTSAGQALRQAAIAALTTRTELKDELGADFSAALDEILQAVGDLDPERLQAAAGDAGATLLDPKA